MTCDRFVHLPMTTKLLRLVAFGYDLCGIEAQVRIHARVCFFKKWVHIKSQSV